MVEDGAKRLRKEIRNMKKIRKILTILAFALIISGLIDILFVKIPIPAWTIGAVASLMGIALLLIITKREGEE